MIQRSWSRLPSQWILDGGLRQFRDSAAYIGRSAAALKLLLTVALVAEDVPDVLATHRQGTASLSYDELCRLAGLSRPLIVQGKKLLCAHGLIRTSQEGRGQKVRYTLANYRREQAWARIALSSTDCNGEGQNFRALHSLSCRQSNDLNALKVYIALSALSGGEEYSAPINRSAISEITNIDGVKLKAALDKLSVGGFISQVVKHHTAIIMQN